MKMYNIGSGEANNIGNPFQTFVGKDLYVGIDVHKVSWHVTLVCEGRVVKSMNIPGSWDVLKRILERFKGCRIYTVYEAGYFGYSLYDQLVHTGYNCTVVAPSLVPLMYGNKVKTDRGDSTKLALLLWQGALKSIYVPTEEERSHRTVVRRYHQLVKDCVRTQVRIKAEVRFYNIPFPAVKGAWTKQFIENLHRLTFRDRWLQESFSRLLSVYDHLRGEIDKQRKVIYELAKIDRYRESVKLLRTIPGVGILTAMEFLVELQDVRRFGTGDKLAAYVGLTPSQHSSGQHVRMGRITRVGRGQLRAMLVEAAWILIRKDQVMRMKYEALKYRIGGKKAIVAIAHKLLLRARRVVLDGSPYRLDMAA